MNTASRMEASTSLRYDKKLPAHCLPECPPVQGIFNHQYSRTILKHVGLHGDPGGHPGPVFL
jgi:hypothetical protein